MELYARVSYQHVRFGTPDIAACTTVPIRCHSVCMKASSEPRIIAMTNDDTKPPLLQTWLHVIYSAKCEFLNNCPLWWELNTTSVRHFPFPVIVLWICQCGGHVQRVCFIDYTAINHEIQVFHSYNNCSDKWTLLSFMITSLDMEKKIQLDFFCPMSLESLESKMQPHFQQSSLIWL